MEATVAVATVDVVAEADRASGVVCIVRVVSPEGAEVKSELLVTTVRFVALWNVARPRRSV